ncbi:MAG TPA: ROK family transcriptional regulator [Ktedonobacteraceae bacterium]|nr:ROK family transcriptional regulator [Ktedonobacteraceae bacterium]
MKRVHKSTVLDIRRINRSTVLRRIYQGRSMSRQELSQHSGLSPATVTNVVVELLQEGIVLESGIEASQGGRPRSILTINPHYGYFIGVEVGETRIRIELFDLTLRLVDFVAYTLALDENQPERVVQYIHQGIRIVLAATIITQENVVGVGIGVGGLVEQGLTWIPDWDWRSVPLASLIEEGLHMPISLENSAKAMAQVESLFGTGRGYEHMVVLLIGTGIGAGIIADDTLYRGASNSAGEWGHTSVELDGRLCRCGSHGCLEAYAGAPGIIERLREMEPESLLLQDDDQENTVAAIVTAARDGNPAAIQVLKDTTHYLGVGIANLINLFNPQLIVLGGWVGLEIGAYILPELRQFVARYALKQPFEAVKIEISQLGQDAAAMGAAALILEQFLLTAGRQNSSPS